MSARVDRPFASDDAVAAQSALNGTPPPAVTAIAFDDDDRWGGHSLPSDHPAWLKDVVSISARARAALDKLQPAVVRVVQAWEHRVRSIVLMSPSGGPASRLDVDASGCYRLS